MSCAATAAMLSSPSSILSKSFIFFSYSDKNICIVRGYPCIAVCTLPGFRAAAQPSHGWIAPIPPILSLLLSLFPAAAADFLSFPSNSIPDKSTSADLLPAMAVACSRHRSPLALYLHSFPNAFSCFRRSYPFWQGRPRRNGSGASSACYFTRGAGASGAGAGAGASAFFSGSKKMAFTNTFTSTTRRPVMVSMAFLTSCWTFLATSWIR